MYCDEEAKLSSKPANEKATIAWYRWLNNAGRCVCQVIQSMVM
jgi:hypothetical protein